MLEGTYTLKNSCGFKTGHKYLFEITKPKTLSNYVIHAIYDITDECEVNIHITLSSEKSIEYSFGVKNLNLSE